MPESPILSLTHLSSQRQLKKDMSTESEQLKTEESVTTREVDEGKKERESIKLCPKWENDDFP